jgi:hypothetical protein
MFIDYNKLKQAGYSVNTHKEGVTIEPEQINERLGMNIFNLLFEGSSIGSANAKQLTEQLINKVQVLEIVKVLSE